MRESPAHILSRKTFRGAALAVASFSVLSAVATFADGATSSEGKADYSVESASDTLAAILRDAHNKGFVKTKPATSKNKPEGESQPAIRPENVTPLTQAEPFNCSNSSTLDFSDLEDIQTYEGLSAVKAKYNPDESQSDSLSLARAYIALGLGDEALEILHSEDSSDGRILKQVAQMVAYPEAHPKTKILSEYKDCSQLASLWAFLEAPSQFSEPFNMADIRNTYYLLDDFPPVLKERISKSLAIAAAESDHRNLALYLLERLENKAREEGAALPGDQKTDYDYLYLSALLQKDSAPESAISKFNFLSERESIYRANSVKYLAEIKSRQGKVLGENLEEDLKEVSAQLKDVSGAQQAAYQLVSGQIGQDRLNDSIYSARSFLEKGTPEYKQAQSHISELLAAHLNSESEAVQSAALDTLLRQVEFLKETAEWEDLKSAALETSLSLGLPELVTAIQLSGEEFNNKHRASLEKARILLALKTDNFDVSKYMSSSPEVIKTIESKIIDHALRVSDLDLAKLAINKMAQTHHKLSYEMNLAWLEENWSKAQSLSERQDSSNPSQADKGEMEPSPRSETPRAILKVLATPALDANDLKNSKWKNNLVSELSDMEEQIKISKAFLSHG